jgi:HlyD family secretion protein
VAVAEQAKRDYQRTQQLIGKGAITESELHKAIESAAVADAGLARADAAIIEGEQQVLAADKTLAYHQARLADTQITAPFDGLIVQRQRDPGDVVVPGSSVLQLVSLDQLWIRAWVDETEMAKIAIDQPARVVFRSEPDKSYRGEVSRLGKEADRETREFIVDVHVLELPKLGGRPARGGLCGDRTPRRRDPAAGCAGPLGRRRAGRFRQTWRSCRLAASQAGIAESREH